MSTNTSSAIASKLSNAPKAANTSSQLSPSSQQPNTFAGEVGQRRSGGSNSFGSANKANSTPRSNQSSKAKHKQSRKFRLADEDALAESAAMNSTSSRKGQTSITHLMNFSLPPRPSYRPEHRYTGGRQSRKTWGMGSGYHAVDKARYVHANYRFIVDPRADYRPQSVDADVHIDWNNVMQILVSTQSQEAACPICLGTPVAPRMARCGHIFCLPCLIRYMHSEDDSKSSVEKKARWKKCPICWDSIYISETRPVRWYTGEEGEPPREGMDMVLRLVQRQAGSTLAMPRESTVALGKGEAVPWYLAPEVMDYARVMKGSEDYMLAQYDEYICTIKAMEQEDELMFGEDSQWTGKAIRLIQEAKEKVMGIGNPPAMVKKPQEPKETRPPIQFNESDEGVPEMYSIQQAHQSTQHQPQGAVGTPATEQSNTDGTDATSSILSTSLAEFRARQHAEKTPDSYLFYQGLLHYYLSPLDIRILKVAFGTYENFPSSILPRVERVSTGHIVDDELRKRIKYLGHLPYGCEVGFLECDWTDTVPPAVLDQFKSDIERRRRRNMDKEAREEKERILAEKVADKEYAAARRKRTSIPNDSAFSANDFQPLGADIVGSADGSTSSPPWANRTEGSAYASLASPGTSPANGRTVWGTTAIGLTSPELRAIKGPAADDGWLQGWEKELLGEDELLARVQAASLGEGSSSSAQTPSTGGGGKKKKGKKITLMSTNARRGA